MVDDSAYSTHLGEMQQLIDRAGHIEQNIAQYLDQIERRVAAMHVHWDGDAATAHQDAHRRWQRSARDMHAELVTMRDETTGAHENYSGVVDHHQRMWPQT